MIKHIPKHYIQIVNEVHLLNIVLDSLAEGQELGAIHKHNEQAEGGCKADLTRECSMYIVTGELDCLYSYDILKRKLPGRFQIHCWRKIFETAYSEPAGSLFLCSYGRNLPEAR